jgi:hypothetical protein
LAVLVERHFKAGGDVIRVPVSQQLKKERKKMSAFVKKYPAISLLVLAMIFGTAPSLAVAAGLLPPAASQLGALSSSLAAIVLVVIEGRKGGLPELLGRFLIWRLGIQWWAFALLFAIIPSVAGLYVFEMLGGPKVDWSGLPPLYTVVPSEGVVQPSGPR